jgi:translocation protein SEC62
MYAGNMMWSNIATGLVIGAVVAFTLLPIWPDIAKKVLWYFSVTFLIVTFVFILIRSVAFLLLWIVGYDFWIFPRLFDESLSFQDSFKPMYSFEKGSSGQGYYRVGMFTVLGAFLYWALSQPTEFDSILKAQKDFIDDLYSGKLLADVAFDPREHLSNQGKKNVPSLEDLLKELEKDEKSITDGATEEVELNASSTVEESDDDNNSSDRFVYINENGDGEVRMNADD